jgi:hypothetical protein
LERGLTTYALNFLSSGDCFDVGGGVSADGVADRQGTLDSLETFDGIDSPSLSVAGSRSRIPSTSLKAAIRRLEAYALAVCLPSLLLGFCMMPLRDIAERLRRGT